MAKVLLYAPMSDLNEPMGDIIYTPPTYQRGIMLLKLSPTRPYRMRKSSVLIGLSSYNCICKKEPVSGQIAGRYSLNEGKEIDVFL